MSAADDETEPKVEDIITPCDVPGNHDFPNRPSVFVIQDKVIVTIHLDDTC